MADEPTSPDRPAPDRPDDRIETSAETAMPSAAPTRDMDDLRSGITPGIPKQVGQYRIKRAIASGGMGTVYEALQERPRRTVAVKFIRAGIASPSALRRFEYEAQLLARLRHPGIAQIYEAGTHQEGDVDVPFFAMEYIVAARPITDYVKEKKLGTRERIRLFIQVCEAVHHGHQKGIIHRDLKPSNILVDSSGRVKIIDFGVARSTDSDMAVTTLQTDVGALLGTLQYMSPEQCAADPHDIDTRSDVYTLGVILYEVLTGQVPYQVKATALHEATRIIREQQPARPSTIDRALRGDLETIALMALEKDRDRRYQSASALTADLKRYLNSEAISARPPSVAYQLRVFARRNKGVFGAATAVFAVLVAGVVVSTTLYFQAEAARGEAAARAAELEQVATFQEEQLTGIDVPIMGVRMRQGLLEKAREAARRAGEGAEQRASGLDAQLAGVDFTGLSLSLLKENIFQPTVETIDEQFAEQPLLQARLLQAVAATVRDLGLVQEAVDTQDRALALRREHLGEDHVDTLISTYHKALVLMNTGNLDEAEEAMRRAVAGLRRVLGEDPRTFQAVNDLGIIVASLARHGEAEPLFREALEGALRTGGETHDTTLEAYNNVGWILTTLGKVEEAELYYRKSLEGNRKRHGEHHKNTLVAMNNMSGWLRKMGRGDEGLEMHRQSVEGMQTALGMDHPLTAQVIHNLAHALEGAGKNDEAGPVYLKSFEASRTLLGEDNAMTAKRAGCYGDFLNMMAKPDQAEFFVRRRLEGYRKAYGMEHPQTVTAVNNLCFSLNKLGRYEEVATLGRASEPAARQIWAEQDPVRLGTYLSKLGEAQVGLDRYAEAEPTLLEAHEFLLAGLSPDHARVVESASRIVEMYQKWEAAEPNRGHGEQAAGWISKGMVK